MNTEEKAPNAAPQAPRANVAYTAVGPASLVAQILTAIDGVKNQVLDPNALLESESRLLALAERLQDTVRLLPPFVGRGTADIVDYLKLAHATFVAFLEIQAGLRFLQRNPVKSGDPTKSHLLAGQLALREEAAQQTLLAVEKAQQATQRWANRP